MSLIVPDATLDFSRLKAPSDHGDVLVVPEPRACVAAVRANAKALRNAEVGLLGSTLAAWRRRTREAIAGRDDAPIIVLGHQPAFVHPGVWAKHVVAARLARAVSGLAINLVVDSDAPSDTILAVPSVEEGRVVLRSVRFAELPPGHAYEQIARHDAGEIGRFEGAVREAMGEDRYRVSQMPTFFSAMAGAGDARDWVDQAIAARRSVEASFDIVVEDRRVSLWDGPLLADMLINACRFAASYNTALARYRRAQRVRGAQRPIPDLRIGEDRCEVPVWAYRAGRPRRRVFVARAGDSLRLFAGASEIGDISVQAMSSCDAPGGALRAFGGWRLRPRALALTLWARLLLADLFIHGIGGAKYDRISDAIMADYYGLAPPQMACVSATLHLGLPAADVTRASIRAGRHALRDLMWNPQRNLARGPDIDLLAAERAEAIALSLDLRAHRPSDHRTRREIFQRIRDLNAAMLNPRSAALVARRTELELASAGLKNGEIARGRTYFFGLFDHGRLTRLLQALPAEKGFRV